MSNGKEEMSGSGSQSSWMAHWTRDRSFRPGNEAPASVTTDDEVSEESHSIIKCHPLFDLSGRRSEDGGLRDRFRDAGKRKMVDFADGSATRCGLLRLRNESSEGQPSLMLGRGEEIALPLTKKRFDSTRIVSMSTGPGLNARNEMEREPNCMVSGNNGLGILPSPGYFLGATSQIVPYVPDNLNQTGSSSWDHKKKFGFSGDLLVHDPSTSRNERRGLAGNRVLEMPPRSTTDRFSFRSDSPEAHAQAFRGSMRIHTTIDSVTEFSATRSKVSHTTHHVVITKKTDVELPDEGQVFQQSSISTKGKSFYDLFGLKPGHSSRNNQGVKLQQLETSSESKGKEDNETVQTSLPDPRNESSTETNTMDMDTLRRNHLRGLASPASSKEIKGGQNSNISQDAIASVSQEVRGRMVKTMLPDINEEFHLAADDKETSTSITQCLDVECLLSLPDNSTNLKSRACPDPVKVDPCSRWVNRLKPCASEILPYSYGPKSSDKVNRSVNNMIKCGQTDSGPMVSNPHGKDLMGISTPTMVERKAESTSTDSEEKTRDVAHSHTWIRRWSRNPVASPRRKADCVMASESRHPKGGASGVFPEKQFPSIAAMALMGKAMTGFRPCEFKKRGCLVLWSTKGY